MTPVLVAGWHGLGAHHSHLLGRRGPFLRPQKTMAMPSSGSAAGARDEALFRVHFAPPSQMSEYNRPWRQGGRGVVFSPHYEFW